MATKAHFEVDAQKIKFTTMTNGDRIDMRGIHLGADEAANFARLINEDGILSVTVKVKGEEE